MEKNDIVSFFLSIDGAQRFARRIKLRNKIECKIDYRAHSDSHRQRLSVHQAKRSEGSFSVIPNTTISQPPYFQVFTLQNTLFIPNIKPNKYLT